MPSLKEIKTAVNTALKKIYPKVNIYGADTVEGYARPCFFVYVDQTFSEATKNAIHKNVEIEIDYIQKVPNESEAMDFFTLMEKEFCLKLKLPNRQLSTSELNPQFVGNNKNIPAFFFDVEFWDVIEKEPDTSVKIGSLELNEKIKQGG